MTVAQEQVREFLSTLPAAAFPMSNGMLAHLARLCDTAPEAVAMLSGKIPEGKYRSPEQVLRAISNPGAVRVRKGRTRTNGSRRRPTRSRPGTAARRAS